MRIGAVWEPSPNAHYRAIDPLQAMERRGHEVVWPTNEAQAAVPRGLEGCDVVHVYRHPYEWQTLRDLTHAGTAITYDNDDDFTTVPKQSRTYRAARGLAGHNYFALTSKVARMASVCTTTNELLANKYRRAGAERVEVIGNYLAPDAPRPRNRHHGIVIGWIAGGEHRVDADRLKIAAALERVVANHEEVRVETIGVNLALHDRYRHDDDVSFRALPRRIAGFDIGIAPLADIPFNRARSDIKLKEYAASGVPWLASPVGPYCGLGEDEGGRLVNDDGWLEALDALVTMRRERRRLAGNAKRWAKRQTIEAVADRWEQVFLSAVR